MSIKYNPDLRPFTERIIWGLGYKEQEALKLGSDEKQGVEDYGSLMPIQGFLIHTNSKGEFLYKNTDIKRLNTWSDHYRQSTIELHNDKIRACDGVPFLVARRSSEEIAIYKKRIVEDSPQVKWNRKQVMLKKDKS